MNKDEINNQLHDLLDGRIGEGELRSALENVSNDENATHSWRNYNLIGDVIRGEVSETGHCLVSKISDALEQEPTILAPVRSAHTVADDSGSNVVELKSSESGKNDTLKAAGMFAIAASVALFAVLGISPAPPVEQSGNNVVAVTTPPAPTQVAESQQSSTQAFEAEFGQMLVTHGEFTSTTGLNGLASYAKMVSNESLGQ